MKKSKIVTLVLITAALASCHKHKKRHSGDWNEDNRVYMRSDSSAGYSRANNALLWWYAFRPYGMYYGGEYHSSGYYSNGLHESSNIGTNSTKSAAIRGGFGRSSVTVSS